MKTKLGLFSVILSLLIITFIVVSAYIVDDKIVATHEDWVICYLDAPINMMDPTLTINGRVYLPVSNFLLALGGKSVDINDGYRINWKQFSYDILQENDTKLSYPLYIDDTPYISLYDVANLLSLAVVFEDNKILLYDRQQVVQMKTRNLNAIPAYIRLEDITADVNGNFSYENLEKLRVISDYFYKQEQQFYIAWIPLYTNPPRGIQNDLTENFTLYNASFIYTMDYMVNHGGHIVLHGLTHQENDTISAIGCEFGDKTPFTSEEICHRLKRTKEIAEFFGYENNIFEFPHYSATEKQLKFAERYFDIIFQQYNLAKVYGRIEKVNHYGRSIIYVPTPLGFIESKDNFAMFEKRITEQVEGEVASLFYHPYMEYDYINCTTVNGMRIYNYSDEGVIPRLVETIKGKNMVFSAIKSN